MFENGSKFSLGLDIGSISINTVLINDKNEIIDNRYDYCHGKPFHVLLEVLTKIIDKYSYQNVDIVAFTGSGGKKASEILGGYFVNEIISQSSSVAKLYPHVKTIIEMGGEDSKLISMDKSKNAGKIKPFRFCHE